MAIHNIKKRHSPELIIYEVLVGTKVSKEYNKSCYFCGFKELVDLHHIVKRGIYRDDTTSNLLPLCKNCHILLHSKHLGLENLGGFWILKKGKGEIIMPMEEQIIKTLRFVPYFMKLNNMTEVEYV